jgi:SAM-dependent methyltransferase
VSREWALSAAIGALGAMVAYLLRKPKPPARPVDVGPDVPCPLVGDWPASWRRLDLEEPKPNRPDVLNASEWDGWWVANHVSAPGPASRHVSGFEVVRSLLPFLRARPGARVLSAGCGVSLEVRALAAAGVDAVGLDVSELAIAHARSCTHFEEEAARFLSPGQRRRGGSAAWVTGSLLDPAACPGPFDAIICRATLQYFWRQGLLDEAIDALTARLAPDGVLVVTSHGDVASSTAIPAALLRHGYAWDWSVNLASRGPIRASGGDRRLFVFANSTG